MRVHPFKKGIRVLGIAESFRRGIDRSVLAGVVMRKDLIVDGIAFSRPKLEGDDATERVLELYERLERKDVNVIMVSGAVISLYNIIDLERVYESLRVPLISLSYRESKGLEGAIRKHFPDSWERKVEMYRKLGRRESIHLKTGKKIFIRRFGLGKDEAREIIDAFILQGRYPEPVRVAGLVARAVLRHLLDVEV